MRESTGVVADAADGYIMGKTHDILYTLSLVLLTGSNFSDFAILFTFRVLILAILDFNHKTH